MLLQVVKRQMVCRSSWVELHLGPQKNLSLPARPLIGCQIQRSAVQIRLSVQREGSVQTSTSESVQLSVEKLECQSLRQFVPEKTVQRWESVRCSAQMKASDQMLKIVQRQRPVQMPGQTLVAD